ncbi:MAG TPA: sigma-70 family RNA polymerase sigma factor [Nitriliruptorales bacterium]|nr:sigma-70 family RNA polymerase sigma factor [Nitriliruptorales bacterium]
MNPIQTLDPEVVDLVTRAQQGDGQAFASLYDLYVDQVYGFVFHKVGDRDLAEDLTSDVFLRALRALPRFRWQGVDIGAWFITIARNRVTDHFKSARARLVRPVEEIRDEPDEDATDDPESLALAADLADALGKAMELLKEEHREVLFLRFTQTRSVAETAECMDRSEGAIKALQYRALRALAQIVRDHPAFAEERGR